MALVGQDVGPDALLYLLETHDEYGARDYVSSQPI